MDYIEHHSTEPASTGSEEFSLPLQLQNFQGLQESKEYDLETPPSKKLKTALKQKEVLSTGLETFLNTNIDAKLIKSLYYKAGCKLDKNVRSRLVRLVMKREKESFYSKNSETTKFTITKERFLTLSHEICKVFTTENPSTYYVSFSSKQGVCVPTSGKLYDAYNNEKKKMRVHGKLMANENFDINSIDIVLETNSEEERKLEWLKYNTEPVDQIKKFWDDTYALRRSQILSKQISVHEYMDNFAYLKFQEGSNLLKLDFQRLYPEVEFDCAKWKIVKSVLIEELAKVKTNITVEEKAWVLLLPTLQDDALIFYLLPLLITSRRQGKRSKKNSEANNLEKIRKLSTIERRESFILHVQNASELDKTIEELKKKLRKKKETLQPIPIVVGDLINIEASYVLINNIRYMTKSCLDAFDLAFKVAFAVDSNWPSEATTLWLFIQQVMYGINLPGDLNSQSSNIIIGYINSALLKESEKISDSQ